MDRIGDNYRAGYAERMRQDATDRMRRGRVSDGGFQEAALTGRRDRYRLILVHMALSLGGLLEHRNITVEWLGRVVSLPGDGGLDLDDWLERAEGNAGMREQFDLFR